MNHGKAVASRSRAARSALGICIGLICCVLARGQGIASPPTNAAPADKDAYVNGQLTALFAGVPVRLALRRAFERWMIVNVFADGPEPAFQITLRNLANETAAQRDVQDDLHSYKSLKSVTKAGYDELYTDGGVLWIGRRGTIVVSTYAGPAAGFDAGLAALAQSLSASPELLPNLIRYAHSMHFAPTGRLHSALAKLGDKVPELSQPSLVNPGRYGPNSVDASFTSKDGYGRSIIAKAYDSEAAAREGLQIDQSMISAGWKSEVVQGVKVYMYPDAGAVIMFQHGFYTFRVDTTLRGNSDAQPLFKIVAAVVELIPDMP